MPPIIEMYRSRPTQKAALSRREQHRRVYKVLADSEDIAMLQVQDETPENLPNWMGQDYALYRDAIDLNFANATEFDPDTNQDTRVWFATVNWLRRRDWATRGYDFQTGLHSRWKSIQTLDAANLLDATYQPCDFNGYMNVDVKEKSPQAVQVKTPVTRYYEIHPYSKDVLTERIIRRYSTLPGKANLSWFRMWSRHEVLCTGVVVSERGDDTDYLDVRIDFDVSYTIAITGIDGQGSPYCLCKPGMAFYWQEANTKWIDDGSGPDQKCVLNIQYDEKGGYVERVYEEQDFNNVIPNIPEWDIWLDPNEQAALCPPCWPTTWQQPQWCTENCTDPPGNGQPLNP